MTKHLGWIGLIALSLLMLASEVFAGIVQHGTHSGETISVLEVASGVTTDTTTPPVAGVLGIKTFQWKVTGTGAVTQTAVLNGSFDSDGSYPTVLCTITISGTAPAHDVCPPFTAPFPYLFITTTNTTGTGASGAGKVGY